MNGIVGTNLGAPSEGRSSATATLKGRRRWADAYANTVVQDPVAGDPTTNQPVVGGTADVLAPVAAIGSPADGAVVSGNVEVSGSASDDVGVASLRLLVDGKQVAATSSSSLSYRLNARKLSAGSHTITLEAYDAAGNVGSHSIRVKR